MLENSCSPKVEIKKLWTTIAYKSAMTKKVVLSMAIRKELKGK